MTERRYWRHERRVCWWCHVLFLACRSDEVYCSAICGRAARGLDENGAPKRRVA